MVSGFLIVCLFLLPPILPAPQDQDEHLRKISGLSRLVGTWNVSMDFRLPAGGPWEESEGTAVISTQVGSRVLEENYAGTRKGRPFYSKTLLGADNLTLVYQRISVDSEHGALVSYEGSMHSDSLIFDRHWTYPNGSGVTLRVLYRMISTDEFSVESMRMPEGAAEWDTTSRMRYRRKKE